MTQTKEDYVGTVLPEMGTVGQSTSVDTTLKQGKVKVKVIMMAVFSHSLSY